MINPLPANPEIFCYADLLTWPADERWELIDGVAYAMSLAPSLRHQRIAIKLSTQFEIFLENHSCVAVAAPFDVRLPEQSEDGMMASTVVQPDLTVVCDRAKLDEHGCIGSPTLVVEILSPETATRDLREKFHAYEQAGVPEYWVISQSDRTLMVFTLDEDGRYGTAAIYGNDEQAPVGVLPGLVINLGRVFAE
jgi:Uma2 family endonuclease